MIICSGLGKGATSEAGTYLILMEQTDGHCPGTQLSRGERPRLK